MLFFPRLYPFQLLIRAQQGQVSPFRKETEKKQDRATKLSP